MGRAVTTSSGVFPDAPEHLGDSGKAAWNLGSVLWAEGVLKERDLLNWTIFAEAVEEKEHCETVIAKDGEYQLCVNGCYAQHPAIKRKQHVEDVIRKYSLLFGLLPEARKKRPAISQGVAQRPR